MKQLWVAQLRNQRKRELTQTEVKKSKQSTLDDISFQFNIQKPTRANKPSKAIVINDIAFAVKGDELTLKIDFTLLPSQTSFSKINLDLYFEDQLLNSATLSIPQSALLNDNLDFPMVLDMRRIGAGNYLIRVEMYELWSSDEKLNFTSKEIVVDYIPQTRESRLVKMPTVKSVEGSSLTIVSSSAKDIYRELEQDLKKESRSKRDDW